MNAKQLLKLVINFSSVNMVEKTKISNVFFINDLEAFEETVNNLVNCNLAQNCE